MCPHRPSYPPPRKPQHTDDRVARRCYDNRLLSSTELPYAHPPIRGQRLTKGLRTALTCCVDLSPFPFLSRVTASSNRASQLDPSRYFFTGLLLHAPTPIPRPSSLLFSDAESSTIPYWDRRSHPNLGPQGGFTRAAYNPDEPVQAIFPTLSELISQEQHLSLHLSNIHRLISLLTGGALGCHPFGGRSTLTPMIVTLYQGVEEPLKGVIRNPKKTIRCIIWPFKR